MTSNATSGRNFWNKHFAFVATVSTHNPSLMQHYELWHDGWKPEYWREKRRPLVRNSSANMLAGQRIRKQQWKNCWTLCFLYGPCRGPSEKVSQSWVESRQLGADGQETSVAAESQQGEADSQSGDVEGVTTEKSRNGSRRRGVNVIICSYEL
jgi:hypothetical protein